MRRCKKTKKLLAIILALALIFVFAACDSKDTASTDSGKTDSSNADFVKPENYASVVLVTINPQFRLYLDAAGEVLAVEPVNDDAKSISNKITTQTGNIENVIENIVSATNEGGFVKENATVNFEITEIKDTAVNTETVLDKVKTSADDSFKKLEITVEVKTSVAENAIKTEDAPTNVESKPTHTHSYSTATCLDGAVCSCGETGGPALGHNYKDGACTRCGAKDPNTKTPIAQKSGVWKGMFWINNGAKTYYKVSIDIANNLLTYGGGGTALDIMGSEEAVQEAIKNGEAFQFDGEWWVGGFGGSRINILSVSENGNTITITTDEGTITLSRESENSMKVSSCSADLVCSSGIKSGTTFTLE